MRRPLWTLGTLILGLALVFTVASRPDGYAQNSGAAPAPLRIGVVNLKAVFEKYQKAKDFEKSLEAEKARVKIEVDRIEKEQKALTEEIKILDQTSDVHRDRMKQLITDEALKRYYVNDWNQEVAERLNKNTAILYNEIRAEIDAQATAMGFDLILKVDPERLEENSGASAIDRINSRVVLFVNKAARLDITDAVLNALNAKLPK